MTDGRHIGDDIISNISIFVFKFTGFPRMVGT